MQSILWDLNKRVNRVAWPDGNEATVAVFRAERHWPPKRACTYRGTPATPAHSPVIGSSIRGSGMRQSNHLSQEVVIREAIRSV